MQKTFKRILPGGYDKNDPNPGLKCSSLLRILRLLHHSHGRRVGSSWTPLWWWCRFPPCAIRHTRQLRRRSNLQTVLVTSTRWCRCRRSYRMIWQSMWTRRTWARCKAAPILWWAPGTHGPWCCGVSGRTVRTPRCTCTKDVFEESPTYIIYSTFIFDRQTRYFLMFNT